MPDDVRAASEAFHKSMEGFLESMGAGDPVPSVAAEDVKRWWNTRRQILNYYSGIRGCKVEGAVGIDLESLRKSNPSLQFDYPTPAALFRCGVLLEGLFDQGLLGPWQHGEELEDAVFRVAADFPLVPESKEAGFPLNYEKFLQRIREESGAK